MFFIGQNLKHVHMTNSLCWTFDLFLINSRYLVIGVYSHHTKEISMGNQPWNTNHELGSETDAQKKPVFNVKLKLLMNRF